MNESEGSGQQPDAAPRGWVPTGLEGPALQLLGTLIAKFGPTAGKAIFEAWKGENPVFVGIRESWRGQEDGDDTDYFYVVLDFINVTPHGEYVEALWVEEPKNLPIDMRPFWDRRPIGQPYHPRWAEPEKVLPVFLPGGTNEAKPVYLRIPTSPVLKDGALIRLKYKVGRLDEAPSSKDEKQLSVRLRRGTAGE